MTKWDWGRGKYGRCEWTWDSCRKHCRRQATTRIVLTIFTHCLCQKHLRLLKRVSRFTPEIMR